MGGLVFEFRMTSRCFRTANIRRGFFHFTCILVGYFIPFMTGWQSRKLLLCFFDFTKISAYFTEKRCSSFQWFCHSHAILPNINFIMISLRKFLFNQKSSEKCNEVWMYWSTSKDTKFDIVCTKKTTLLNTTFLRIE